MTVHQLFWAYTGYFDHKIRQKSWKPWLRSSWESNEIEYCIVDGSGVTVLQAGLQSWQTEIQLKSVLSFHLPGWKKSKFGTTV